MSYMSNKDRDIEYALALENKFINAPKPKYKLKTDFTTCPKCGYPGNYKIAFTRGSVCDCGWVDKETKDKIDLYSSVMNALDKEIVSGEEEFTMNAKALRDLLIELNAYGTKV